MASLLPYALGAAAAIGAVKYREIGGWLHRKSCFRIRPGRLLDCCLGAPIEERVDIAVQSALSKSKSAKRAAIDSQSSTSGDDRGSGDSRSVKSQSGNSYSSSSGSSGEYSSSSSEAKACVSFTKRLELPKEWDKKNKVWVVRLPEIGHCGFENNGNNCAITSVLSGFLAYKDDFDKILLQHIDGESDDQLVIRELLIKMANTFRVGSKSPIVSSEDVQALKELILPIENKDEWVEPHEFMAELFKKLGLKFQFVEAGFPVGKNESLKSVKGMRIQDIIDTDDATYRAAQKVDKPKALIEADVGILVIKNGGMTDKGDVVAPERLDPQIEIIVGDKVFKLASIMRYESDHYTAYSLMHTEKSVCFFDSHASGRPSGSLCPGLYYALEPKGYEQKKKVASDAVQEDERRWGKLPKELKKACSGAEFIYVYDRPAEKDEKCQAGDEKGDPSKEEKKEVKGHSTRSARSKSEKSDEKPKPDTEPDEPVGPPANPEALTAVELFMSKRDLMNALMTRAAILTKEQKRPLKQIIQHYDQEHTGKREMEQINQIAQANEGFAAEFKRVLVRLENGTDPTTLMLPESWK